MLMKTPIIISFLIAFLLSIVLGPLVLPVLRKLKAGQTEREDGPKSHLKKTGTPTMGAFIFLLAAGVTVIITVIFGDFFEMKDFSKKILPILILTLAFALIGFIDDFIKVILKRSEGLTPIQKMALQIFAAAAFSVYMAYSEAFGFDALIPFTKGETVNFAWFNIPLTVFIIVGTVNGSNFTDGVDGLETQVTSAILVFFIIAALIMGRPDIALFSGIFLGALLGFLMFNVNKALVFMGDTGSLSLGALVTGLAYALNLELYLPILALIYFAEVLSVIIQVLYFKKTHGKRIFRMAPIHHHFELGGWSEAKVVAVFTTITVVLCAFVLIFI